MRRILFLFGLMLVVPLALAALPRQDSRVALVLSTPMPLVVANQITPTAAYTVYLPLVKTSPVLESSDDTVAIIYHWHFIAGGELFIFGELKNQGEVTVNPWAIDVNFFDETGNFLGTRQVSDRMEHLPPGETTCFGHLVSSPPEGWAYYEMEEVEFSETLFPPPDDVVTIESQGVYNPETKNYTVLGAVQNIGSETRDHIEVVITVYDTNGLVTGCADTNINQTYLDPGEVSYFELEFISTYRDRGNITGYRLQIDN